MYISLCCVSQILTPFMLRRLKQDVDLDVPPKREILVYAPLVHRQKLLYFAALDKTIKEMINPEEVCKHFFQDVFSPNHLKNLLLLQITYNW